MSCFVLYRMHAGIYRFMNNPELVLGYLGMYGCALVCRSWVVLAAVLLTHALHTAIVFLVEVRACVCLILTI